MSAEVLCYSQTYSSVDSFHTFVVSLYLKWSIVEKFDEKQRIDEKEMLLRQEMKNFLIHYKNVVLPQLERQRDCLEKVFKGTFMSVIIRKGLVLI